jgi:uncharacterized cupredoxin-like copper-binding protein
MSHRMGLAALCAATLALAACGGGASAPTPHTATATVPEFKITLDSAKLAPGSDSFSIKNAGAITHEFVIVRTDLAADALPIGADGGVDEKEAATTHVDETEGITAGGTGSLTVSLPVGQYVVFCNLPGHYKGGMHAGFAVTSGA